MLLTTGIVLCGSIGRLGAQTVIKNDSIRPYIDFLERGKFLSAKDYILSKFETKDIVILSERFHHDMSQYDVILDVVKDERFRGHIYTEIGHVNLFEKFNDFLTNPSLTEEQKDRELLDIYRDLCPTLVWDAYNYYYLLSEIWEINKTRKKEDKILIFPTDIPFDYGNIRTHREWAIRYEEIFNSEFRDQAMGMNFIEFYEGVKKEKEKALVIMNARHGYKQYPTWLPLPTRPLIRSAGEFINKAYPNKTFTIYINSRNIDNGNLSNNGIIDAAFEYTKTTDAGFDLKGTPVGNAKFDLYFTYAFAAGNYDADTNYDYIFDGMVFYKPLKEMVIKVGIPGIYSEEYEDMYFERVSLLFDMTPEEARNNEAFVEALNQINAPVVITIDKYLGEGTESLWESQIKRWID